LLSRSLLLGVVAALSLGGVAQAAPGDLDSSFGNGGQAILTPGGHEVVYSDVAIQPDGKIVLAGYIRSSAGDNDIAVTRLNANGTPDQGFAAGGTLAINTTFGGVRREDLGNAVALQPDGKIVVAGQTDIPTALSATIARVLPSGTLDSSFAPGEDDGDGVTWSALGAAGDVAVDKAGRIIAAGDQAPGSAEGNSWVERLNPNGSHDASFGTPGLYPWQLSLDLGGLDGIARLALLPDGRVIGAGSRQTAGTDYDAVVARVTAGTGLDGTFGTGGSRFFGFGQATADAAQDVVIEPGGKIDVAGYGGAGDNFTLTRLTANGALDPSFSGKSTVEADFGRSDAAYALALQANGKLVLAGEAAPDFGIARFQPGGAADATFGPGGKRTVDFGTAATAQAIALQPDGKIVVAGYIGTSAASGAVVRLQGDSRSEGGGPGGGGGSGKTKVFRCGGKRATIVGTNKRNRLRGTRRADVIVGLGGNDTISGLGGNDIVCGGGGNDKVSGGKGNDKEFGSSGNDKLTGDAGKDTLSGDAGKDTELGGPGNDKVLGGSGKDKLNGGAGKDLLNGGGGKDKCAGRDRKQSC
jgi:uncharacterized delta-60 repeat protein